MVGSTSSTYAQCHSDPQAVAEVGELRIICELLSSLQVAILYVYLRAVPFAAAGGDGGGGGANPVPAGGGGSGTMTAPWLPVDV